VALVLVAVGIAFVIAAIRGTLQGTPQNPGLLDLLYSDFVGPNNFFVWIAAIGLVGAVGYVKPLRGVSDAFIVLIIIVFILAANKGGKDFFSSFNNQLVKGTANASPNPTATAGSDAFNSGNYSGSVPLNDPSLSPLSLVPSLSGLGGSLGSNFSGSGFSLGADFSPIGG
jgi:hypothetical protein